MILFLASHDKLGPLRGVLSGKCSLFHMPRDFFLSKAEGAEETVWLAQLVERQTAVGVLKVRVPDQTNTQGLKITEENVLRL